MKKYRVEFFLGKEEIVLADSFSVTEGLVVFQRRGSGFLNVQVLALQASDITRITYLGEYIE